MTIEEADRNIGAGVVYSPAHGKKEDGVITSVNSTYVFVRFTGDQHAKATLADDLELLVQWKQGTS